ncbi:MAG: hypothetical protein GWN01_04105 [Nitrosopumilaceae archaeon]|nr:hypothetical protein [Nitrosopumilaceae archaeon]NIU86532.1 hypothetical protein [Nitrosopumilaceae archaeon]NIV65249.1 hypothetical protein [Nitrosopumilaceae archaeon]NIX60738.1 hypothetical protein [Nitrosopumilaceae archaeon]
MNQPTEHDSNTHQILERSENDAKPCFCEKTTCMIGIASIAIGVGGFIVAHLL